jgi:FMN phosphatase YigB (HAD superfamily)
MSTEDRANLRAVSFREFADEWLDRLNRKYDEIGDLWIDLFRTEIREHLNSIGNRVDALITLLEATAAEEAYEAFVAEFGEDRKTNLPAYEALLPIIRALGGRDDDSALTIIGIFDYARARRLSPPSGDNINLNTPHT